MNWKCLIGLLCATSALAVEDPPNCSLANGGLGNTSGGGVNFTIAQAHIGDTVSLVASLYMVSNACKTINATGSLWISTGRLTNFLENVTLEPYGFQGFCPTMGGDCEPGPYSFVVTAPMVGAGVTSPNGNVSGIANRVRAIQNGNGSVQTTIAEPLADFHSTSTLVVVNPCIAVYKMCASSCAGSNVFFTGYVQNCGDITLTNVTVTDNRTASLFNIDGTAFVQPLTLTAGQMAQFKGDYTPSGSETTTATNTITVTGTDTTTIGGPRASVTNSVTTVCTIASCNNCTCPCLIYDSPRKLKQYALR